MRLLVDMNLSPRWVGALCEVGVEATHWREIGEVTAPDTTIFAHAQRGDFVVLTSDLDFGAILAATKERKPSVIQLRGGDLRPEAAAGAVALAIGSCSAELQAGALLTLNAARLRVTLLPLREP